MTDEQSAQPTNGANGAAPRVSVITPAYNSADHLERALDSALAQTMPDLEIVVVDDASTDDTLEVARRVAARDPRVRVLHNERNGGAAVSRNRAIDAARGEWVAVLDADDEWLSERLEKILASAGDADVVSDDVYIVRSSFVDPGKSVCWSLLQEQGLTEGEPRWLNTLDFVRYDLGLLKAVIRRSFLGRHRLSYEPALRNAQDFHLYFEILASGARWLQLPHAYYLYYKYLGSMTTSGVQSQAGKLRLWQNVTRSTQSLFDHPATTADPALVAALERRLKEARSHVVFATFWENLRQRRYTELARSLRKQPAEIPLIASYLANRIYLRIVWTIRRLRSRRQQEEQPSF